jgi:hypothetical protein
MEILINKHILCVLNFCLGASTISPQIIHSMYKCEASVWRFNSLPDMVMRGSPVGSPVGCPVGCPVGSPVGCPVGSPVGSPVSGSGRRWSEMNFFQHSANFVIDETFDVRTVFCFQNYNKQSGLRFVDFTQSARTN